MQQLKQDMQKSDMNWKVNQSIIASTRSKMILKVEEELSNCFIVWRQVQWYQKLKKNNWIDS